MDLRRFTLAFTALIALLSATPAAGHDDQKYGPQEKIPLFVDTVVPENNPSESYPYYSLPFCKPPEPIKHKSQSLGEQLGGSRKIYSPYDLRFRNDVPTEELCTTTLSATDVESFRRAIAQRYHFTMHYDEIPLRGYIGEVDSHGDHYLYTSLSFAIEFNEERVIEASVAPDPASRVKLSGDGRQIQVTFAYSVRWKETEVNFEDRTANNAAEMYQDEVEVQWFSITNSCILAILLTGFVVYVWMRALKKDFASHEALREEGGGGDDESGWKRLHADVFRFPKYRALFCAILGCGVQIALIFVTMLTLAVIGVFHPYGRGTAYATAVGIYALTAIVAGFTSGAMYKKMNGSVWVHNVLITVALFVGPLFLVWAVLNTIAIAYGSTSALPFGTIMALFATYFLVTFPLTLAGAIAGKNLVGDFDAPTRTRFAAREIPEVPWYRGTAAHLFVAGFLPFSATYLELYYVFISIWGHQLFTPFGILYLVFILLLTVAACITAALTYLQLSAEDHRWWWTSMMAGGSTGVFVLVYCFYFLEVESRMSGLLQVAFYFGYMSVACYALFLMLGTVGFFASLAFVRQIFSSLRSD